MDKMLLVDLSKCTGCEACIDACSSRGSGVHSEESSMVRLKRDEPRTVFVPLVCEHCAQHPCADACPEEAIKYDPGLDIFMVDDETCTGCGQCEEACPFEGIFITNDMALKCDLCQGNPLCVKFCYARAIQWVEVNPETVMVDLQGKVRKMEELRSEHERRSS